MSRQHAPRTGFFLFGGLAVAVVWLAFSGSQPGNAGQAPPATSAQPTTRAAPEDRPADREAVKKALDGFTAAFGKGDAKAVGALFTAEGEYISDEGTTIRGRAALEKDYAAFFAKNPGNVLDVEVEAIRFPSRDTAVAEGHF
ncbi:MAG: SgcJ/EcaC family oxidoreductase, partial [Gemmataceae bacterium]